MSKLSKLGKRGTVMVVTLGLMAAVVTLGVVKTARNGVLKSNGQRIWCKMMNNGAGYCDAKYK